MTLAEYRTCVDAHACTALPDLAFWQWERVQPRAERIQADVAVEVPYEDAVVYCRWRGKRLPTVAEWEKAARGSDDRIFPWGDRLSTPDSGIAASEGSVCRPPGQVGLHPAGRSPYGVEDLGGNAGEWTSDWFGGTFQEVLVDAFERVARDGYVVLVYDWNANRFTWPDRAVDPAGPLAPDGFAGHTIKGACDGGGQIALNGTIHTRMFTLEDEVSVTEQHANWRKEKQLYLDLAAGIRCVRPVPGPMPPKVTLPAPGVPAYPYREPGFENPADVARRGTAGDPPTTR